MNSKDIRQSFITFFKDKQHSVVRSASVAPLDDPTLLFTNAGMNQFKPIFLEDQEPKSKRIVNSQKCIRVSGKHNDLEEVGIDTFHHTFFEMLGNWSFGDYYKAEAIKWAWELFTEVWKLDKNRLWATVYTDDDEAFELWKSETDIAHDRILRFGKKDNFWEMGETGPCGPCSEIHYFVGKDLAKQAAEGVNKSAEYWELWNLVFIQFNRDENGKLHDLPKKHVDTGAGFERIVSVLQNKVSNYETDLFQPLLKHIEKITGVDRKKNPVPHQVIADHVRMLTFAIADGVMPSNEGRGYIVRRILRRASRFGRVLNQSEPFIYKLVDTVGEVLGEFYPEIIDRKAHIINVIKAEEKSFNKTLDRGLSHFDKILANLKGKVISGKEAFKLYDTYGFPLDLTQLIARENNLKVDESGFKKEMKEQVKRAKSAGKFKMNKDKIKWETISKGEDSEFLGYETLESKSKIIRWSKLENKYAVVLDQTPFYAESGGQIGDNGTILGDGIDLTVIDTQKENESIIHFCKGDFDESKVKEVVNCSVDKERRDAIRRNHTATHLLHAALKQVLGEHVHQAGSSVGPENFRFDLTHFEKISNDELQQIEKIVNDEIIKNTEVIPDIKSFDEAKKEGAEALFGEKYGDVVRVLTIGNFSKELCGGTHVNRTSDIGLFKIIEESSLAAGVRRIVAITGREAVKYVQEQLIVLNDLQSELNVSSEDLLKTVQLLKVRIKELIKMQHGKSIANFSTDWERGVVNSEKVGDYYIAERIVETDSIEGLRKIGDKLSMFLKSGVGLIGMRGEKNPSILVYVTQDLIEKGINANNLAKLIGQLMDGGGGGKSHLAIAGGGDNNIIEEYLSKSHSLVRETLEKVK